MSYELINKEQGLENEISDSEYNSSPHYKQLKYRRKREREETRGYEASQADSSPFAHPFPDYGSPSDPQPQNDFGGFGGGDGGGGGASGGWESDNSSSSDSYSSDSGSSDSGSSDCGGSSSD